MPQPEIIDKPKRWRRIGWYSLAVAVLTLIGLYAFAFWRYEQQQAAIAEIERLGGTVEIEDGGPEWLRGMAGDERMKVFDRVVSVRLLWTEITDDDLRHVSGLTNLQDLGLDNTQITDDGLRHLSGLTKLERLDLAFGQITDDGLKHLSGLTNLERLDLFGTQITDDGLRHLSGLTKLVMLRVAYTQITDEGKKNLQEALPNCDIVHTGGFEQ